MDDNERARQKGVDPRLLAIYNMLPSVPEDGSAPIDHVLKYANPVGIGQMAGNTVGPLLEKIMSGLGFGGQATAGLPSADAPMTQFGEPAGSSISRPSDAKASAAYEAKYGPMAPGLIHHGTPEYPPPGLSEEETIAWALAHPPRPEQRLAPSAPDDPHFVPQEPRMFGGAVPAITPEDIDRWDTVLSQPDAPPQPQTTTKTKSEPAPKPKAKPAPKPKPKAKKKVDLPWLTQGLGPYGNQ